MSNLSPTIERCGELLPVLMAAIERCALQAVVLTGCGDGQFALALAATGLPLLAADARPEAVAATRARLRTAGFAGEVVQGLPARVLADHRRRLPGRTLWVFGPGGVPGESRRDELFMVPPGEGVVCVLPDEPTGTVALADVQDQLLRWSPDHHVEATPTAAGGVALLAFPAPRVHVTFLIEKYTHEYGKSGLSINLDNLVATLAATGLASWNVVHYDQCFHEGRPLPIAEISKPAAADVHVLVTVLHYHTRSNPTVAQLQAAKRSGSRIVYVWLDKKISRSTPEYAAVADLNVLLDGNDFELPNSWPSFTPKNPQWFCDPGIDRDIDCSLVGEVRYLSQRKAMVDRLRTEARLAVQMFGTSAADTRRTLSLAEYARLYQRSKISLAMTKDNVRQLKGRVFEILHCGAMLLCDRNHHVSHYLRPGVDYVVYEHYEDLVEKARYYLDHGDERAAIAHAGHARVRRYCSHEVFWRGLLSRVGASAASFHGIR
jgi:hypothetical protein